MSGAGFSQGRWHARPGLDPWRWVIVTDAAFPLGGAIASLERRGDLASVPECAANARLISAAPDMYAALRAALEYAPHGEACAADVCSCWQRFARAALAKAEGREP